MCKQYGFSLIELSIVLFVSALLMRAAIVPLPQVRDAAMRKQTHQQLQEIKQALIGHIIRTGVLPCPVSLTGASIAPTTTCRIAEGGVPAATLGVLGSINSEGAVLDAWGRPLRYALSQADHKTKGVVGMPDWSVPGEIAAIGVADMQADLRICLSMESKCANKNLRADQLVAVVLSDAGNVGGVGAQLENQDGDNDYALTAHSMIAGKVFDDIVVVLSRSDVAYWLLRGNWLAQ